MRALLEWFNTLSRLEMDGVVRSAVVHLWFDFPRMVSGGEPK